MKAVVFYESADDLAEKAPQHFAAHVARYQPYIDRGDLVMIGTFADPQENGSMAIFTTREAAEQFVANDPFVLHGVVKSHRILDWNESLAK
ncbi:YciI family protein [Nocardia sp. NBC_01388]|uniref:YciI family protein n=1 Tax=Nocardia sp. NBC_01388 TaxID=2903596 RepID=UPI003250B661